MNPNPYLGLKIMVCGEVGVDRYLSGKSTRTSPEADVPVVTDLKLAHQAPGMSANVYMNLKALGASPILFTIIGADENASYLQQQCIINGLVDPGRPTIEKARLLSNDKQVARLDHENTSAYSDAVYKQFVGVLYAHVELADAVVLQDYGKGLWTPETLQFISYARSKGKPVFVDPYRHQALENYQNAFLIKPNMAEAMELCRAEVYIDNIAYEIKRRSLCDNVVITRGREGMFGVSAGTGSWDVPALDVTPVDISGAGDTALSVLVLSLVSGASLLSAMQLANKAAGKVIQKFGTSTITWEELNDIS